MEKDKRFCICCCKPLKDKYRLMKDWEADGSRRSICDSYAADRRWRIKSVSHVLPYGAKRQKATDDVDTRTRSLRDRVSQWHITGRPSGNWSRARHRSQAPNIHVFTCVLCGHLSIKGV